MDMSVVRIEYSGMLVRPAGIRLRLARRSAAVVLLLLSGSPVRAQERFVRTFGPEAGLTSTPAWAIAQDSVGFLWIGTEGGLFRFDGSEFSRWAPDSIRRSVVGVTVAPDGRVAALEVNGRVFEITAGGARSITDFDRRRADRASMVYDRRGVLWLLEEGEVKRRGPDDRWHVLPQNSFEGEGVRHITANRAGAIDVLTNRSIWRIEPEHPPRRLLSTPTIPVDAVTLEDGRTIVLTQQRLIELSAGGRQERSTPVAVQGRRIAVVERSGTVWVALDNSLLAFRSGEPPERMRFGGRITYGGRLLVDREGSLWMGGNALHQFPEPETLLWSNVGDVSVRYARFLERSDRTLWVSTWAGMVFVEGTPAGWSFRKGADNTSHLCADGSGSVWSRPDRSILELRGNSVIHHPSVAQGGWNCAASRPDGVWVGDGQSIAHVSAGGRSSRLVPPPAPLMNATRGALLHDSRDRLWASIDPDQVCSALVPRLMAGSSDAWSCDTVAGMHVATDMIELPTGTLWLATHSAGMFVHRAEGWRPLRMDSMPTQTVLGLKPSPRGGAWMAGHGFLRRVQESASDQAEVVERINQWHGFPGPSASDVLEDEGGDIWLAWDGGLARVPAAVRSTRHPPPPVALVEATIDGELVSADTSLELPHDRNRLELRFAALSFRNPTQLHHQVRLGPDEPWSASRGSPSFRWVDLRPGDYEVEYRASLDGVEWSEEPVRFALTVLPAWYATPWAIALAALLVIGAAWTIHRARVAHVLALERQRTRIAMDLHDEMGSGLASIGILAGVLSGDNGNRNGDSRIAREVAATAEALGASLSDIVWSLDPHAATLQELVARLAEHGSRLFADDVQFDTAFPAEWPAQPLPLAVVRSVLLIGLEALHNAARHADAEHVLLSLHRDRAAWILTVRDDGAGLPPVDSRRTRGRGLRSMRRRADEITAELACDSKPGAGTTVRLRFDLSPRRRRLRNWLWRRSGRKFAGAGPAGSHDHADAPPAHVSHR
jgi:signal transduction histidine kinase/ligand-binding sensor domain-containing protein